MKIQNILSERFMDDDYDHREYDDNQLKPGYSRGDHQAKEEQVTVGPWVIKFKIFQETINSPVRYSSDSPPESDSYVGDVHHMEIESIHIPSANNYDVPDIEYEVSFPITQAEIHEFTNMMISLGDDHYHGEDQEQYNKLVGYVFHNNPDTAKNIFKAMEQEAHRVYKGKM